MSWLNWSALPHVAHLLARSLAIASPVHALALSLLLQLAPAIA